MPFSLKQKAIIGRHAREAWEALDRSARREATLDAEEALDNPLPSQTAIFTHWRQSQQKLATGEASLTRMNQDDYLKLMSHFQTLRDTRGLTHQDIAPARDTVRTLGKIATEPKVLARHKLGEALQEAQLPESYAAAICRNQYKCELDQASAKQLWSLFYTVRNRRKARK